MLMKLFYQYLQTSMLSERVSTTGVLLLSFYILKQEESIKQNHRSEIFTMLKNYVCAYCPHYESPVMGKMCFVIFLYCIGKIQQNLPGNSKTILKLCKAPSLWPLQSQL